MCFVIMCVGCACAFPPSFFILLMHAQASPLVAAAWGVGCLGEFHGAAPHVRRLLAATAATYAGGVVLLALSAL